MPVVVQVLGLGLHYDLNITKSLYAKLDIWAENCSFPGGASAGVGAWYWSTLWSWLSLYHTKELTYILSLFFKLIHNLLES